MPIEIEIGFKLPDELVKRRLFNDPAIVSAKVREQKTFAMTAEYYDTPSQALIKKNATLRRRLENGEPFVTLKTAAQNGGRILARNTWECPCSEVSAAIGTLMDMGAPPELLSILNDKGFVVFGRYEYTRKSFLLRTDDETSIEMNFDEGVIISEDKQKEFSEVLFKLLFGSQDVLEDFVFALEEKYSLTREFASKYDRVLRLIRSR